MIKTISIHAYKSFPPNSPVHINFETDKQATFIYGLNGAGKSAIGQVIHGKAVGEAAFAHCKVETAGTGPFRFLVYNNDFVNRVIGETMQGIFTIGETDTIKQKEIDEKTALNKGLVAELPSLRERVERSEHLINAEITRGIESVWKAHGMGKATTLGSFLTGYGRDKKGFFADLRGYAVAPGTKLDTLERLEQRWADASGADGEKPVPLIDLTALKTIESDPIWEEAIEVSSSSRLAPRVAALGNADWVGEGRGFVRDGQCPFCQESLPHDFEVELAALLEGTRRLKIEKIFGLISSYALHLERLDDSMVSLLEDSVVEVAGLRDAWENLRRQMASNQIRMRSKVERPSEPITIDSGGYEKFDSAMRVVRDKIDDFNQRIRDRGAEQAKIKTMFYQVLCTDRSEVYALHDSALAPLQAQLAENKAALSAAEAKMAANDARLAELKSGQTGVDASVTAINEQLKDLGITSFWINRRDGEGHLYCLGRPEEKDCSALSLSEGERTLISFLYFVELIKGSQEEAAVVDISKTIVVIDDPISSLSQNYVYDVATIIGRLVRQKIGVSKVRQVIVLTHNLFFFHEIVYQVAGRGEASGKCQMLRIQKGKYSALAPLDPKELQNDYDALWNLLREARDGKASVQAVPNAMRCILEQFFTFTAGNAEFEAALAKMGVEDPSSRFAALKRYLDRGSHKDAVNGPPIDWAQYDTSYYLDKLRALLRKAGHEAHYLRKMGEEPAPARLGP